MIKPSLFQRLLDTLAEQSAFKTANILIVLSAAGWMLSSLAQVAGIYFNKNYTKEQKSFMIPQELADAAVNIGLFLAVTKSLKSLTTKMVETGKLAPKSIRNFIEENGLSAMRGKLGFNVSEVEGFDQHQQTYNVFKTVAESTAALVGGVVSSNVLTPFLRNKIAAKRKNSVMEKLDNGNTTVQQPVQSTGINTTRHTFEDFTKGRTTIVSRNTFDAFRHSGMRI